MLTQYRHSWSECLKEERRQSPSEQRIVMFIRATLSVDLFAMSEEWSAYHRAYANNAFDSVQKILTIFCGMYIKAVVLDEWYDVRRKMSCKGLTDDKWVLRVLVEEPTLKNYLSLTYTFWHDVLFRSVCVRNMEDFWSAVHEWIVIRLRNDIAENDIELF